MNRTEEFLWHIIHEGELRRFDGAPPQEVIDRNIMEMEVITKNKFTDYILIIWDIHDFCRTPDRVFEFCKMMGLQPPPDGIVPLGPGRGSVGGSMACYCIGIHDCDPMLFGLYFERFLNPERIAYPDIDFDISQRYRYIVLAYIAWRYGQDRVAQIITFSTLSAKTVIHDVLAAACVPDSVINAVKALVPDDPDIEIEDLEKNKDFLKLMQSITFPDIHMVVDKSNVHKLKMDRLSKSNLDITVFAALQNISMGTLPNIEIDIKSSWTWERAISIMKRLEGLNKHESTHAAGVVVAPVVLDTNVPLMSKDGDGVLACQYDMRSLEDLGFLKMDALGLRTVDVNHDTAALVRKWYDPDFDMDKIRLDDIDAINLIRNGDTVGIFQVESSGFTQMMKDLQLGTPEPYRKAKEFIYQIEKIRGLEVQDFMWVAAGNALYRPGPLDAIVEGKTMVKHLIDRKMGKEPTIYLFPEEENYLSETYGVLTYQEQVMARVRQMTGCTYGRADILRKAMGKKDPVLMKEQMDWFMDAAMKCDFSIAIKSPEHKWKIIERAGDEIRTFARYGFNKAHACEYALTTYRNAYFKAKYPVAFYASLLNSEIGNGKRQAIIIRDMMKHNINLLPPLINESDVHFTMTDRETIRFGLAAIKGLGGKGVEAIVADKVSRGPYGSVEEFRIRVPATICNKTVMGSLAKCGAFDSMLNGTTSRYCKQFNNRLTLANNIENLCEEIGRHTKKKGKNKPAPTVDDVLAKLQSGMIGFDCTRYGDDQVDKIEYANWEKQILNYFISAHPIDAYVDEIERWTAIQDTEMEDLPNEFYIAGFLSTHHETTIKKEGRNKGKSMGFVTIETAYRAYEATLFPGIYESCLPYIKVGNPVVLKGKREFYKDNVSIQGLYMRNMMNSGIRDCPECHMRFDDVNMLMLAQLRSMFDQHPGLTKVFIHIISGYHDFTIECNMTIALNDRIINFCKDNNIQLAYKPI